MLLFSIFDKTAHTFGPVVQLENIAVARRLFKHFLETNPDMLSIASDLAFVSVGEFDPKSGNIVSYILTGMEPSMDPDVSVCFSPEELAAFRPVSVYPDKIAKKSEVKE